MGLTLLALVCVGAADSTWGGIFTDFVEATPLALGSRGCSVRMVPWAADCSVKLYVQLQCRQ